MTDISLENGNCVIGLIPAAGRGTRLGNLPYSKELLPVPGLDDRSDPGEIQLAIENSTRFLLECGAKQQHIVIAPGKQDIPNYLGDGSQLGASISYTTVADSPSVPHSLDAAHERIAAREVVLAFPDILFEPRVKIAQFLASRPQAGVDILLALVPSTRGDKVDMVSVDADGTVSQVMPKPGPGRDGWMWVTAAWSPAFTAFLHDFLGKFENTRAAERELYVGDVLNAAVASGLRCQAAKFPKGWALDIGTADDFGAAWCRRSKV
jgi:glucose-1-phosphate thymidylyltransferase